MERIGTAMGRPMVYLEGIDGGFEVVCFEETAHLAPKVVGIGESLPPIQRDPELSAAVTYLRDRLPDPEVDDDERGDREESFYRLPIIGHCWCGRPVRMTLDGAMCEMRHTLSV